AHRPDARDEAARGAFAVGVDRSQCPEGAIALRPRAAHRRVRPRRGMTDMSDPETPERRTEVRRLADALRQVIERFVATTAPLEVFHGVADDLEAIAARLNEYPQEHLFLGFAEAANAGDSEGPFDNSPLMGLSNPLAPPLRLDVQADKVAGTVVCGSAYEGPPGHVHGGYVAAMFDELLGLTQSLSGKHGMTGRLTVHYRSPTPLHTELRL